MEIRNFKVTSVTAPSGPDSDHRRIDFTCEGKGRIVDWNWIEGYAWSTSEDKFGGPLENPMWKVEWVVIIQRGGREIKRKMKLTERSRAITKAIGGEVALWVTENGTNIRGPASGPQKAKNEWPANSKDKMARSGPQGQKKTQKKTVARPVALGPITLHPDQLGPQKDSLDIPEFLRR